MLVAVANQRGVSEEELRETWSFRRLLHCYIVMSSERAWWVRHIVEPLLSGLGTSDDSQDSVSTSGGQVAAARPSRAVPSNYRWLKGRRPGRVHVVHVEDDLRSIATVLPIGGKRKDFAAIKNKRMNKGKT